MPQVFSPQNDFLLPIGAFAEKLLGNTVAPDITEKTATIQAQLIVLNTHLPVPDNLSEQDAKKYKQDFLFKSLGNPDTLLDTLHDVVPAEIDLDRALKNARATVDAKQGVPDVPAYGQILSKFLPKELINTCLQAQAGLRIIALNHEWPGFDKIPEARIFDNDPPELKMAQDTSNKALAIVKLLKGDIDARDFYTLVAAMPYSRNTGFMAIIDAQDKFDALGFETVADRLQEYTDTETGIESIYPLPVAYQNFMKMAERTTSIIQKHHKPH